MQKKIKVIVKDPGKPARVVWISNTLENLQRTVGGYIEIVTISTNFVIICNKERKLLGLPHNCRLCGCGGCRCRLDLSPVLAANMSMIAESTAARLSAPRGNGSKS